jgi:hypothetical protein
VANDDFLVPAPRPFIEACDRDRRAAGAEARVMPWPHRGAIGSVPGRRPPSGLQGPAWELRGRRREWDVPERLLKAVRCGESRVLVVRGEPGLGKTALLDYLVEHARAAGGRASLVSRRSGSSRSPGPGVASYQAGPADGDPVLLLHGFPNAPTARRPAWTRRGWTASRSPPE